MNLSEQIKQIDLVALAESVGVELHRTRRAHVGRCPLHSEDNPSFYIYPTNRFKCYGCGEGGDSADFIQCFFQCDFGEALRRLGIKDGLTEKEKSQIKQRQRLKAKRIQRERDLIHTLSVLIRATRKCMATMTPERFEKYGEIMDSLPAWEYYHDVLARGTKEEKDEVIEGLKDMTTIRRRYLFRPDFNYRKWLFDFNHNETKGVANYKKGAAQNGKNYFR